MGQSVPGVVGWRTSKLRCLELQEGRRAGTAKVRSSPSTNSDCASHASFFVFCVPVGKLLNLSEL